MKQTTVISALPLLALLASATAHAADGSQPLRVEFLGRPDCPDHGAFMAKVRARSARIRDAEPGETARTFQVTLSRAGESFHGELGVVDASAEGSSERTRSIDGDSCEEVVDALALFTVLAVDPAAVLGTEGSAGAPESSGVPPPLPESKPPPAPAPVDRPPRTEPPRREARETDYRAVAGIGGGIMAAGTPAPLPAMSGFVELGLDAGDPLGLAFAPTARVSVLFTTETTIEAPPGSASLRFATLSLDLCPLAARANRSLTFRPCFTATEGRIHAAGSIDEPKNVTTPFRTLGALARGEWAALDRVPLELTVAIVFPLRRDSFFFEPSTPVYEVPAVVGLVTLGGGFRFL